MIDTNCLLKNKPNKNAWYKKYLSVLKIVGICFYATFSY